MINHQLSTNLRETLTELDTVLSQLGTGQMHTVAYDTAWIARLALRYPGEGFDEAIEWLRTHQKADGSWGSDVLYFHDRFISTLSAVVALKTANHSADAGRIKKAEDFLWHCHLHLHHDKHDTIAFPVLAVSLLSEARMLGLDVPRTLYYDAAIIEKKLNLVGHISQQWRHNTMSFSLEAAQPTYPDVPDFLEDNGSVGASPAATASMLIQSRNPHEPSMRYLRELVAAQGDGGAPDVSPVNTFEASWSLNLLRAAGAVTKDHPEVQRLGKFLYRNWKDNKGIGFSSYYSVPSLDDTGSGFGALNWIGYDVSPDAFAGFEEEAHFCCFPNEANPSLNATLLMLSAMRTRPNYPRHESWVNKIMNTVRRRNLNGEFYFDKWHASPYYLCPTATVALHGYDTSLIEPTIHWIKRSQHQNGGWGYYGQATTEETAYGLISMVFWQERVGGVDPASLDAAARYLVENMNSQPLTPMWIGKCLYTPPLVVRSAILGALHAYANYKGLL